MSDETVWLEGAISVTAALTGGCRAVYAVYVQKGLATAGSVVWLNYSA
jgi:hypothetical protein